MKKHHKVYHVGAGYYLIFAGLFLILTAFALSLAGIDRFYALFSPQGTINPSNLTGTYDATQAAGTFNNQTVPVPAFQADSGYDPMVLGATNNAKRIEIDLANQRLYGFEGENKIHDFPVSTGKWNKTPTGIFQVWVKLRYSNMRGGSKPLGTYYNLPNVPYVMFFSNDDYPRSDGYGIHGTYWHDNFGEPMSHGCVNMDQKDVAQLYYWAEPKLGRMRSVKTTQDNPGIEVIIYGETPSS